MGRQSISRADAKSEYGGASPWLRDVLDLPEYAELDVRDDGAMHGGVRWTITFPYGEQVEFGGYFSKPPVAYYHADISNRHRDQLEEIKQHYADA